MPSNSTDQPGGTSGLPAHVQKILNDFVAAAKKAFGGHLESIVLFGSAAENRMRSTSDVNVLVVLSEFQQKDITALAPMLRVARAAVQLEVMYLLEAEVPAAIECFAQKFGDIIQRHRVLAGNDPLVGLAPSRGAEIYRLRQVILNLQLRMRQGFAERAGREDMVALLIAEMSGPLRTCAAALARLEKQGQFSPKEALERLVKSFDRPDLSQAVSELPEIREGRAPVHHDVPATFFLILEIVEGLRTRVWRLE